MGGLADDLQCKVTVRCPTQARGLSTLPVSRFSQYTIYKVKPCRRLASVWPPCTGASRMAQGVGSASCRYFLHSGVA